MGDGDAGWATGAEQGAEEARALLARYRAARAVQTRLVQGVLARVSAAAIEEVARSLGWWANGAVRAAHDAQLALLHDLCVHDHPAGRALLEAAAASAPPGSETRAVLEAMRGGRMTLLEVERALAGVGVQARDRLGGGRCFIVDRGLGGSCAPGDVLAARPLRLAPRRADDPELTMTSGALLTLPPRLLEPLVAALIMRYEARDAAALATLAQGHASEMGLVIVALGTQTGALERLALQAADEAPGGGQGAPGSDGAPGGGQGAPGSDGAPGSGQGAP